MPQARLAITLPKETWIHSLSTEYPDATFRVVATLGGNGTGVALVEVVSGDPVAVISAIEQREDVTDLALLWKRDDEALLQIETEDPLPLAPVWEAGVPLRTPFEIRDGRTTWETTTTDDRLAAFGDALAEFGVEFEVEYVRGVKSGPADDLLTDRQLEVLRAAAKQGYYETPRTATLTEVAESLDVSKATASDILQRAEGAVIDWFLAEFAPRE
ncbi:helix-turn-helix domain-containing protein [Halorussus lipolyticus]|uniref:helix-turn-helix domain-containing protein n=1 Tax=Halorussus lipolyticus TaxID=3034024 RepID=UPI0023E8A058|nr:helix-turn-helix domain-containing protein [Halorussus sp. DT80]